MKLSVDLAVCVGHGRCQNKCPEVYGTDEVWGKCVILVDEVPEHLKSGAVLGARNCPESAIKVIGK